MGICISCVNYGDEELKLLEQNIGNKLSSSIKIEENILLSAIKEFRELKANNEFDCNVSITAEIIEATYYYKQYNKLNNKLKKIRKDHEAIKNTKSYYRPKYSEHFEGNGLEILCGMKSEGKKLIEDLENINTEYEEMQYNKQNTITEKEMENMRSFLSNSLSKNNEVSDSKLVRLLLLY